MPLVAKAWNWHISTVGQSKSYKSTARIQREGGDAAAEDGLTLTVGEGESETMKKEASAYTYYHV